MLSGIFIDSIPLFLLPGDYIVKATLYQLNANEACEPCGKNV